MWTCFEISFAGFTLREEVFVDEDFDEPKSVTFERSIPAGALGIHLDDENACFRSLDIQDQHPYIPFMDLMGYFFYDIPSQHYQVLD